MKQKLIQMFVIVMALMPAQVWAAGAGASGLPWEGPLAAVARSLTGPVALSISIIALMAAGGTLVFGGELGTKRRPRNSSLQRHKPRAGSVE